MDMPKVIYLIPEDDGFVWCEDAAPGVGQEPEDATEYVRADTIKALEAKQAKALELYTKMTNLDRYGEDGEPQGVYLPFAVLDQLSAIYKEGEE